MPTFRKVKVKRGIHHALLAIDFENDPKTGAFICAGIAGRIRHRRSVRTGGKVKTEYPEVDIERYFTDQSECLAFLSGLKAHSCLIVTFNLSYDRVFMDSIIDHGSLLEVNSRVIVANLKNKIKVIDLTNHVDGSLESWIGYLDMEKQHGIRKETLVDLEKRVMNDARATYRLGTFIEDFYYYELGIPLGITVGSCALRYMATKHFNHYWQRDNQYLADFERRSYYGGRVEVFKRGDQITHGYDVNSMYLSIMRDHVFPDIMTAQHFPHGHDNWREYFDSFMGVWDCTVCSGRDTHIGALPFRLKGKLIFPSGVFRGVWCDVELKKAIELGYEILQVHEFVVYRRNHRYFESFAKQVWKKRLEYKAKGNRGMDLMIKKIGNSLYGKFAQRNDEQSYFGRLSDYKGEIAGNYRFHEYGGEVFLQITKGEPVDSKHTFPVISSFIASYARIKLIDAMITNQDDLIYCDTDSIKLNSPAVGIQIGADLGEWSYEIKGDVVKYQRPKLYGQKRKGVPARAVKVSEDSNTEVWEFDKPLRYREAIKRGDTPNRWITVQKCLVLADDKRWWHDQTGSKPIDLDILFDQDYGSVAVDRIPVESRYIEKHRLAADRSEIPVADRLVRDQQRLDRRRAGKEIWQRA